MPSPTLPPELLAMIINHLDVHTLIRFREVCKSLCHLINHSPSFQYKIELAVAGMDDGPPSDLGPIERLRILNAHQTAWKKLSWKELQVPTRPSGWPSLWVCSGSVLAMGHHTENLPDFVVTLIQLPSVLRGITERTWTILITGIHSVRNFEIDPSQDLIVLVNTVQDEHANGDGYRHVHLHMLSTGEPHPLSSGVLIHREPFLSGFRWKYRIQIFDNMIGVHCTGRNYTTIWDWKTGELRLVVQDKCFSFLTKDLVITGVYTGRALCIYDLRHHKPGTPTSISPLCTFKFPPLSQRTERTTGLADIYTDLSSGKASYFTLGSPFRTSQNDRLYAFEWVTLGSSVLMVFSPLSTFMTHINSLRAGETGRSFSWGEWGERGARILVFDSNRLEVHCIHGMKFSIANNIQIEVYDFNRLSFRRGILSGTAHYPGRSTVTSANIRRPVNSSLPYQVHSILKPSYHNVMISEDCLIPLQPWHMLPQVCPIFCF